MKHKLFLFMLPVIITCCFSNKAFANEITVLPNGNGKTDTANLQKALDENSVIKLKNGATYTIDKQLVAKHSVNLTVSGGGNATILQKNEKSSAFYFQNTQKFETKVTKHVSKGQNFLCVSDTKGILPGDIIEIKSKKLLPWDNRGYLTYGEMQQAVRISGKCVYLKEKIGENYNTSDITIKVYKPNQLLLSNITFTHSKPVNTVMIKVDPSVNSSIYNIKVYNSKVTGLLMKKNIYAKVTASYFNLGTTKDISSGYGIQDSGGWGTVIERSTFTNVRRGIDFSGDIPSRYGIARNNSAYGPPKNTLAVGNSGYGTHSSAKFITFENNYIENFNHAFTLRGSEVTVKNNTSKGVQKSFISAGEGDNFYIRNNKYISVKNNRLEYFLILNNVFKGDIYTSGNNAVYVKWSNRK